MRNEKLYNEYCLYRDGGLMVYLSYEEWIERRVTKLYKLINKNDLSQRVVARYFKCKKCGQVIKANKDYTRFNCDAYDYSQTHGRCCGGYEEIGKP